MILEGNGRRLRALKEDEQVVSAVVTLSIGVVHVLAEFDGHGRADDVDGNVDGDNRPANEFNGKRLGPVVVLLLVVTVLVRTRPACLLLLLLV